MNFLVIGGGSIGRRHIDNINKLGGHRIFCLKRQYDPAFEDSHGAKVITHINQLTDTIDALFVCTPTSMHVEALETARQLNCAVFMEKPLIHSRVGLEEAERHLAQLDKPFFIGFMLRYHPLVRKMKGILEGGVLGSVYSARFEFGSYLPYWHPWEDHRISYASKKELGGGVINTISHELDLIQYFFGAPDSVVCVARNFGKLDIEVEEIAEAVFGYPQQLVTLHLDYLQKDYNRAIKVLGENGSATWNWHDQKISIAIHKAETVEEKLDADFEVNQLYVEELKDFISVVEQSDRGHSLNAKHAIENTRLLLAMHQAATTQCAVDLVSKHEN